MNLIPSPIILNNVDLCHHPSFYPLFFLSFYLSLFIFFFSFIFLFFLFLFYFFSFYFLSSLLFISLSLSLPFRFGIFGLRHCFSLVILKLFQHFAVLLHAPFEAFHCTVCITCSCRSNFSLWTAIIDVYNVRMFVLELI